MLSFKELSELNIRVQKMRFLMQILQIFLLMYQKARFPRAPSLVAIYRGAPLLVE
jgi:hypothetical protein